MEKFTIIESIVVSLGKRVLDGNKEFPKTILVNSDVLEDFFRTEKHTLYYSKIAQDYETSDTLLGMDVITVDNYFPNEMDTRYKIIGN